MTKTAITFFCATVLIGGLAYIAFNFLVKPLSNQTGAQVTTADVNATDTEATIEREIRSQLTTSRVNSSHVESAANRKNEKSRSLLKTDLDSLLSLVEKTANNGVPYDLGDYPLQLAQRMEETPELVEQVLEIYGTLTSGLEKDILHGLLVDTAGISANVDVEKYVVDFILAEGNENQPAWFRLIEEIGVRSLESRHKLLAHLPAIVEEQNLTAVIQSIVPQVVPLEEKQEVVHGLSPYLDHSDSQVRGAAVKTVGMWGGNEQVPVIEQGLLDPSVDVRHAAAAAAFMSNMRSENIQASLLQIMNDESENIDTRQQAHYALSNYALEGQNHESFYRFRQWIEGSINQ